MAYQCINLAASLPRSLSLRVSSDPAPAPTNTQILSQQMEDSLSPLACPIYPTISHLSHITFLIDFVLSELIDQSAHGAGLEPWRNLVDVMRTRIMSQRKFAEIELDLAEVEPDFLLDVDGLADDRWSLLLWMEKQKIVVSFESTKRRKQKWYDERKWMQIWLGWLLAM